MFLADTVHQLPCGHPGCNQHFKTSGWRTKHRHAIHLNITPSNPPWTSTPLPHSPVGSVSGPFQPENGGPDQDIPYSEEWSDFNENGMELHAMESQFYGSGDKLHRNYHLKLTGNVTDFNARFSVGLLTSEFQQSHVMSMANSLLLGLHRLQLLLTQITGPLLMIAPSLKQLTYYTPASKCRHHKSTP